jgi:hypothetical protein
MVDERLKEHKEALENRKRTYKAMSKTGKGVMYFGLFLWACGLLSIPLYYSHSVSSTMGWDIWLSLLGAGFFIIVIGGAYNKLKGVTAFYFSSEDTIFLELFEALTSLETYNKEKLELARNQCLKELNEVLRLIRLYWAFGNVQVVITEIGNEIETFEERFAKNLIFTLESGKEIENVEGILTEFGLYLISPSKAKLVSLNKNMGSLPHSEGTRAGFMHHRIIQHILVIGLILAVSLFSALFGFYYSHISIDTAYVVFATIFGPAVTIYIAYIFTYVGRKETLNKPLWKPA